MLDIVASYHCMQFHGKRMIHTHFILGLIFARQIRAAKIVSPPKKLALSVTRFHGQPLLYTISEKINDPILRKLSDGRIEGRTNRLTGGQE